MVVVDDDVFNARLVRIKERCDAALGAGNVLFYAGSLPVTVGGAITNQVLVAVCALSRPCGIIANNQLTFAAISDELSAKATETITFGRVVDGNGDFVADAGAGLANSTAFFKFDTVNAIAGGTVKVISMVIGEIVP